MGTKQVGGTRNALLVFADVIESSRFSAVLDYQKYAERLLDFQTAFEKLGRRYFPEPEDKTAAYTPIAVRGDEGTVFVVDPDSDPVELVFRAIDFLYHLKGHLKSAVESTENSGGAPSRIGVGAGIHYGAVAYITEVREAHSVISGIEGFSINVAKRVESSSREGKYSHVMLSKEAFRLVESQPLIFFPVVTEMKGVHKNVEVYEVRSGLFSGLKLESSDPLDEKLISQAERLAKNPADIDEPWVKSFVLSLLDVLLRDAQAEPRRLEYRQSQLKLAWDNPTEDDPILLYLRARHFSESKEYTQQVRYLREIIQRHPEFVYARKRMIEACWEIAKNEPERAELVFARDMAAEFLDHFDYLLAPEEKEAYQRLVKEATAKTQDAQLQ